MLVTGNLRRQHTEILSLVSEINLALVENPPFIEQLVKLIPALAGKINIHLAMEDNALYPKLLSSNDDTIRKTAEDFITQMGNLKKVFGDYNKKWNSKFKVKESFEEFSRETQLVMAALIQRINREDKELYDVADNVFD